MPPLWALPPPIGLAVGLIVGTLLFLLLAARSAVRRMNLWQEATLYVLLGVLVVGAFSMATLAPYLVEWFNGPCSDEAMRRLIECD